MVLLTRPLRTIALPVTQLPPTIPLVRIPLTDPLLEVPLAATLLSEVWPAFSAPGMYEPPLLKLRVTMNNLIVEPLLVSSSHS